MMLRTLVLAVAAALVLCLQSGIGRAQQLPQLTPEETHQLNNQVAATDTQQSGSTQQRQVTATYKTFYEFWLTLLTIMLLAVMAIVLTAMCWNGRSPGPEFFRTFVILVVIFAALFLIVAGYTDTQTAPVFSILGSIIGYIFGRGERSGEQASKEPEPKPDDPGSAPAPVPQPGSPVPQPAP